MSYTKKGLLWGFVFGAVIVILWVLIAPHCFIDLDGAVCLREIDAKTMVFSIWFTLPLIFSFFLGHIIVGYVLQGIGMELGPSCGKTLCLEYWNGIVTIITFLIICSLLGMFIGWIIKKIKQRKGNSL